MVVQPSWESFQQNPSTDSQRNTQRPPQTEGQPDNAQPSNNSWGTFQTPSTYQGKPDPTADESTWGYLTRLLVSNAARGLERYAGRAGDIESLGRKILPKEFTGLLGNTILEMMGRETFIPTSEELKRNITYELTGDYTKPKTKKEAIAQEFSADVGSMGRGGGTIRQQLVNKLGIPAAANAAKETVKELGFGENVGTWIKLAAMTALSLINSINASAYAANLMNEGRQGFGANTVANVPRYENNLNGVSRNMLQGDPRSALAQQQLAGIRNDIQNGQTSMRDLMNRYDAINAAKRDRGLFQLNRGDRRAAIRNINQVRDTVRQEIEHLGAVNPQALQSWQRGVNAFSVIHRSNALSNFVNNILTGPYAKSAVAGLFGAGIFKAPLTATGVSVAAGIGYKAGQVAYRVWSDPNLANYYWNAMQAAARNDAAAFMANFNKLDKDYEKKYGQQSQR